jgi:phosphomannomutase/phosphoglucomutase
MNSGVVEPAIFRAYDIRGIVGAGLDSGSVRLIGQAIGSEALELGEQTLLVGRDARLSSPELGTALREGIMATGCNITDLGIVPTPLLYFATQTMAVHSGAMLTGSHNPANYNGIKIVLQKSTLAGRRIEDLRRRIEENRLYTGQGSCTEHDIVPEYIACVSDRIKLQRHFQVVVDCGNGVAGLVAPQLLEQLGCTVIPLYCEPDGNFPNHHPDPTRADNLQDLISKVREEQADLGIALDGDADRIGLVSASGRIIDADKMLIAFAMDILPGNPGAGVVYDVKSSHHLGPLIAGLGGVGIMCKSGHSYVKQKLNETGALLGGEFSAHIFFRHRWFGFDDGLYTACRFLELLDRQQTTADRLLDGMPASFSTPELFIPVPEADKFAVMAMLRDRLTLPGASLNYLDGIRADFDTGWGLVRASNTTPNLVLRFEADTDADMDRIQADFRSALRGLLPDLVLPF